MRDLIFMLQVSDEEAAAYEALTTMIVPLSDAEIFELRGHIITADEFLTFNMKCLSTLQQVLETKGNNEEHIAKTLQMMLEPSRAIVERHERTRELLGRAEFVSVKKQGKLQ